MGMAEEVIIKPNYEKLCSKILNSDDIFVLQHL
ncbi:MAG: hypothetical protein CM1200mP11_2140 [Nitrosopumilaceae archaeon]|nr:MAG: hypothetical protein CM1200mP11_2140 [Nitrosopumilaceae archaeon]